MSPAFQKCTPVHENRYQSGALRRIRNSVVHDDAAVGARILNASALGAIDKGAPVTTDAVDALARAHGMDVDGFLEEIARRIATIPEARGRRGVNPVER